MRLNNSDILSNSRESGREVDGDSPGSLVTAKAKALLMAYNSHWKAASWRLTQPPATLSVPIVNPASGRRSRTFDFACPTGGLVRAHHEQFLLVQRITSHEIDLPDTLFWQGRLADTSVHATILAYCQQGIAVGGVMYDVLRRPEIRPRRIPKGPQSSSGQPEVGTLQEISHQGTYYGKSIVDPHAVFAIPEDGRETPALFLQRLVADCRQRPHWYFQRHVIRLQGNDLLRREAELWQTCHEIRSARRATVQNRNPRACVADHQPCEFLPICGSAEPSAASQWHHRSSSDVDGTFARRRLTPERIACFHQCRRKHFYRYELGKRFGAAEEPREVRLDDLLSSAITDWWMSHRTNNGLAEKVTSSSTRSQP